MTIDPLTGLPVALVTGAVGAVVSGLISLFGPLLSQVPGFRPNDASRTPLMRALVFVLTLAGLLGLTWALGIPLPQSMWPNLLLYAGGGTGFAHFVYTGAKNAQPSASAGVATSAPVASIPAPVITLDAPASPDAPAPSAPTAPAS